MACLDTSFLIDLMREQKTKRSGPATQKLLELHRRGEVPRTTLFTVGELYVGAGRARDAEREIQYVEKVLSNLEILPLEKSTAQLFGSLYAKLQNAGMDIGVIDTLIASVALEQNEILVSRNVTHFSRIQPLKIESY